MPTDFTSLVTEELERIRTQARRLELLAHSAKDTSEEAAIRDLSVQASVAYLSNLFRLLDHLDSEDGGGCGRGCCGHCGNEDEGAEDEDLDPPECLARKGSPCPKECTIYKTCPARDYEEGDDKN